MPGYRSERWSKIRERTCSPARCFAPSTRGLRMVVKAFTTAVSLAFLLPEAACRSASAAAGRAAAVAGAKAKLPYLTDAAADGIGPEFFEDPPLENFASTSGFQPATVAAPVATGLAANQNKGVPSLLAVALNANASQQRRAEIVEEKAAHKLRALNMEQVIARDNAAQEKKALATGGTTAFSTGGIFSLFKAGARAAVSSALPSWPSEPALPAATPAATATAPKIMAFTQKDETARVSLLGAAPRAAAKPTSEGTGARQSLQSPWSSPGAVGLLGAAR